MNEISYINDKLKERLLIELIKQDHSGIYSYTQQNMAYNSNKIEGSTLTKEQINTIFTTGTMTIHSTLRTKDVEETSGHFAMFIEMLNHLNEPLSEAIIKSLHHKLKRGVWEDMANGYVAGEYKQWRNQIANIQTTAPHEVPLRMLNLLSWYELQDKTLRTMAEFHIRYERIHPFQDGNGRTGRVILFRECLKHDILPFIIEDINKAEYYQALNDVDALVDLFEKEQKEYIKEVLPFILTYDEIM